jgi:uncharacterized membrane protein YraQ (UPF0718 family)
VLALVIASLSLGFWAGSRYPDLNSKAEAAPGMLLDGIGFDVVFPIEAGDTRSVQVAKRTANWLDTNKKGMLFGLLLSAAMGAALPLLTRRRFRSPLSNTMLGVAIGAPLGLCVNCAAPLATSLHQSRTSQETTSAAVIASPTLNVIVVSLLFTMLPWHLGLMKVGFTLLLILVVVPGLVRGLGGNDIFDEIEIAPWQGGWVAATVWSIRAFSRQFVEIVVKVVPLMVLAGFLGSLAITFFNWENIRASSQPPDLMKIALVALLGTFLPVPMAFDVIMCGLLYQAGMQVEYVMVLLFTLGSFSIYSYGVFRQTVSKPMANALFVSVALMGVLAGLVASWGDRHYRAYLDKELHQALDAAPPSPSRPPISAKGLQGPALQSLLDQQRRAWQPMGKNGDVDLLSRPNVVSASGDGKLFTSLPGDRLGLDLPYALSYSEHQTVTALANRTIASGDIHNDGWTDLVVAHDYELGGLSLFANLGGKFERQSLELGPYASSFITVACLVDLNNDGWLDLYLASFLGEHAVLWNDEGSFSAPVALPAPPGAFVNAVGFADLDADGDLDLALGTWVHRWADVQHWRMRNYLLLADGQGFDLRPLPGAGGNTHAVLISDIDGDNHLDLVFGNDWSPPDEYYRGDGEGGFLAMGAALVPRSTEWTMSLDSADLDNDGQLEMLAAHIAYPDTVRQRRPRTQQARAQNKRQLLSSEAEVEAAEFMRQGLLLHEKLRYSQEPSHCLNSDWLPAGDLRDALWDVLFFHRDLGPDRQLWEARLPVGDVNVRAIFRRLFPEPESTPTPRPQAISVPSSKTANVLLANTGQGFVDQAQRWGLDYTYWTWNARFAELDGDGFIDLFLVNGSFQEELLTPNLLFLNQGGQRFERVDDQGTADYFPTSNSTYIDLDNDGDLDIITSPPNGALKVLRNNGRGYQTVTFQLEDPTGAGGGGVGAKIWLKAGGQRQLREMKVSGGFTSFDAPVVLFGTGSQAQVEEVEIRWPDGHLSRLSGPLSSGRQYLVRRLR